MEGSAGEDCVGRGSGRCKRFGVYAGARNVCMCVGGCVGAEESKGLRSKRGGRGIEWESGERNGGAGGREEQYRGCKMHRQLANVKQASNGVLLISGRVCLCARASVFPVGRCTE